LNPPFAGRYGNDEDTQAIFMAYAFLFEFTTMNVQSVRKIFTDPIN
jgi:hypothetical protein